MKIISISNTPDSRTAGMARCMYHLADEMRRMGHTADLLFRENVPKLPGRRLNDLFFPFLLVGTLLRLWRQKGRHDLVVIHSLEGAPYVFLRKIFKKLPPCIIVSHGADELRWELEKEEEKLGFRKIRLFSKLFYFNLIIRQARFATRHADHVVVAARNEIDFYEKRYGKPRSQATFIPNGVSESFFVRHNYARPANRLLYLGGWEWRKGIRYLAASFSALAKKHPQLSLSIAGVGTSEATVKESFVPEVRERIHVIPFIPAEQLAQVYTEHDIFIFPSLFESMSLVLPEAMAAGLPVITTRACGMQDIVRDGENGFLVPLRNSEALSEKIESLRHDAALRQTLGTKAQESARELTWNKIAAQWIAVFERLLASS